MNNFNKRIIKVELKINNNKSIQYVVYSTQINPKHYI
jgi:hypothetical protein